MVREVVGLDWLLTLRRERPAREGQITRVKRQYCPVCRRYEPMELTRGQWICRDCGCPKGGE